MFYRRFRVTLITLREFLFFARNEPHQEYPTELLAIREFALALLIGVTLVSSLATANAQEKPEQKPTPTVSPITSPSQRRLGTELDGPVIVNTDLITLTVTVTDTYGRYVSGLNKNAFTILDEKQPQDITFFSDDDAPVSVGVIFDVSGSMSGDKIKRAREALSKFIQTSHDSDEYFLIAFNSRAQLLLDKNRDGNAVLDKLTTSASRNQLQHSSDECGFRSQ